MGFLRFQYHIHIAMQNVILYCILTQDLVFKYTRLSYRGENGLFCSFSCLSFSDYFDLNDFASLLGPSVWFCNALMSRDGMKCILNDCLKSRKSLLHFICRLCRATENNILGVSIQNVLIKTHFYGLCFTTGHIP